MLSKDQIITHNCVFDKSRFSYVVLGLLTVGGRLCVVLRHTDVGVTVSARGSDDRHIRAIDFRLLLGPVPHNLSTPGIRSLLPGGQPQWAHNPRDCCAASRLAAPTFWALRKERGSGSGTAPCTLPVCAPPHIRAAHYRS